MRSGASAPRVRFAHTVLYSDWIVGAVFVLQLPVHARRLQAGCFPQRFLPRSHSGTSRHGSMSVPHSLLSISVCIALALMAPPAGGW